MTLGEPAFDDAFLVEAAPADVAKLLIDHQAREFLASHKIVELTTVVGVLRFAVRGWLDAMPAATVALDATSRIASRVLDAYAEAEHAVAPDETGSPRSTPVRNTRPRPAVPRRSRRSIACASRATSAGATS